MAESLKIRCGGMGESHYQVRIDWKAKATDSHVDGRQAQRQQRSWQYSVGMERHTRLAVPEC